MGLATVRVALVVGLLVAGCGATVQLAGDGGADARATATDAAATADAGGPVASDASPIADAGVRTDGGAPPADVPAAGACPAGSICFVPRAPVMGLSITSGRLGVVWAQLNDDGPDPDPQVAFDVPFDGSSAMVAVPTAAIAAPGDAVLYCARACNDEATCPCTGGPRLGFAYAVVAQDANANGRLDFSMRAGAASDPVVAVGFLLIAQSPEALAVAPAPLNMLFTRGIARGVAPYPLLPGGDHHVLGAPDASRVYELNFCPPENMACRSYLPDLE